MKIRTTLVAGSVAVNSVSVYSVAVASSSLSGTSQVALKHVFKEVLRRQSGSVVDVIHILSEALAAARP